MLLWYLVFIKQRGRQLRIIRRNNVIIWGSKPSQIDRKKFPFEQLHICKNCNQWRRNEICEQTIPTCPLQLFEDTPPLPNVSTHFPSSSTPAPTSTVLLPFAATSLPVPSICSHLYLYYWTFYLQICFLSFQLYMTVQPFSTNKNNFQQLFYRKGNILQF